MGQQDKKQQQASINNSGQVLRLGSKGPAVAELQMSLRRASLYRGAIDGVYGPKTAEAVKQFQGYMRLPVDGVMGPKTWASLNGSGSGTANKSPAAENTTHIQGLGPIPSYKGDFPSPLPLMWYVPKDAKEAFTLYFPPSTIRSWVRQASAYHDVPYELTAVILQQENAPEAPRWKQAAQFVERSLTTAAAIVDEAFWDLVPDKISGGSAGIANMSRKTLRDAADYIEKTYGRPVMPDDVRIRLFGWNQDTRFQGDDLKGDLYYMTAHLRQLIDRVTKTPRYKGPLTLEQVKKVAAGYNGSGPLAEKYGADALKRLQKAATGATPLYFYE